MKTVVSVLSREKALKSRSEDPETPKPFKKNSRPSLRQLHTQEQNLTIVFCTRYMIGCCGCGCSMAGSMPRLGFFK